MDCRAAKRRLAMTAWGGGSRVGGQTADCIRLTIVWVGDDFDFLSAWSGSCRLARHRADRVPVHEPGDEAGDADR